MRLLGGEKAKCELRVIAAVELTPREEQFVLGICHGLAATRAASEAGYSISHARRLLTFPHIKAALREITINVSTVLEKHERAQAKRGAAA